MVCGSNLLGNVGRRRGLFDSAAPWVNKTAILVSDVPIAEETENVERRAQKKRKAFPLKACAPGSKPPPDCDGGVAARRAEMW
mgnify:CR=1 FL=1